MTEEGYSDPLGLETLERFAQAKQFNAWLFSRIAPYCQGKILEVGSGIGNMSQFFLEAGYELMATDLRAEYLEALRNKFGGNSRLIGVQSLDLAHEQFSSSYENLIGQFDTIVALNVIEHIRDDRAAVEHATSLLRPGGRFIMLVPAWQWLYNSFDVQLGHYKRYTASSARQLLVQAGLQVDRTFYFNSVAMAGWWLNGSVMKKKIIPRRQLEIFNQLVPLFRFVDRLLLYSVGLSVIAIGRKS